MKFATKPDILLAYIYIYLKKDQKRILCFFYFLNEGNTQKRAISFLQILIVLFFYWDFYPRYNKSN